MSEIRHDGMTEPGGRGRGIPGRDQDTRAASEARIRAKALDSAPENGDKTVGRFFLRSVHERPTCPVALAIYLGPMRALQLVRTSTAKTTHSRSASRSPGERPRSDEHVKPD